MTDQIKSYSLRIISCEPLSFFRCPKTNELFIYNIYLGLLQPHIHILQLFNLHYPFYVVEIELNILFFKSVLFKQTQLKWDLGSIK